MSRIEKLYSRLKRLEDEYLRLVRAELQDQSDGRSTPWIRYRFPCFRDNLPTNRTVPDDPTKVDRIEKLERAIVATRRGTGEPIPGPAVAIPRELFREFGELGVLQNDGAWVRLVRDAISRINLMQRAAL